MMSVRVDFGCKGCGNFPLKLADAVAAVIARDSRAWSDVGKKREIEREE